MGSGWSIWRIKNKELALACLLLLFSSCSKRQEIKEINTIHYNNELFDGVLVCRLGNGYFSDYFRRYASIEKKFSHLGVISKENNVLYVYHSEASELTGVGFVKKETLKSFLKDIKIYEFYEFNYPDSTKNDIMNNVKNYYLSSTPFDLDFDSYNDDALYCTELVAVAINDALDKEVIKPSLMLGGKRLFSLDDIYLNTNLKKLNITNNVIGKQRKTIQTQ